MKITFVLPPLNMSGGIRVAAVYAQLLAARGHEVAAVSPPRPQPTWRERTRALVRGQGWLPFAHPHPSHFQLMKVPNRVLERYRPVGDADVPDADVVISTWWETSEWVQALSPAKGRKVSFLQHYEMFDYVPQDRVRATYQLPFRKIAVAQWIADILAQEYGDTDVCVVPNAVDLHQFSAPVRGKQPVPTVGMLYSPATWKGCDLSLKAFEIARLQIPDLKLVVFGEETLKDHLPLPAGTDYVRRPDQDRLRELYAQCDGWLFGSRVEGFGLPILEAMACRTPVIGTPCGAAPDLLSEGNGVLLSAFDSAEMAAAIVKVCSLEPPAWKALSDRAYARATRYTWDDAAVLFETALLRP